MINFLRNNLRKWENNNLLKFLLKTNSLNVTIYWIFWRNTKVHFLFWLQLTQKEMEFSTISTLLKNLWIFPLLKAIWQTETIELQQSFTLTSTKYGQTAIHLMKKGLWFTRWLLIWRDTIRTCWIVMDTRRQIKEISKRQECRNRSKRQKQLSREMRERNLSILVQKITFMIV